MSNRTSISSRIRKDGGIKLLDINEQPLGYAQAKKRKRMLELEEQQKKVAEAQAAAAAAAASAVPPVAETPATPEYAQGLASINPPATPVAPVVVTAQSYVAPSTPSSISVTTAPQTRKIDFVVVKDYVSFRLDFYRVILCYSYHINYSYNAHYCITSSSFIDGDSTCRKYTCCCANSQTSSNSHTDTYTDYCAT